MGTLSQLACKTANKISLNLIYGETAQHSRHARLMINESLAAACVMLDSVDPVELRSWYEQFESIYRNSQSKLLENPAVWSEFIGVQCDLMQKARLHQKTIETLGNELARWDRQLISFDQLAVGLDSLSELISERSESLGDALDWEINRSGANLRTRQFSNSICGLAIVLVAISEAIEKGDPRDFDCAATAVFGASLTNYGMAAIFHHCVK
ncbi:MAG: hypothetical protein AB8B55_19960 [Mariniblastus sp.]